MLLTCLEYAAESKRSQGMGSSWAQMTPSMLLEGILWNVTTEPSSALWDRPTNRCLQTCLSCSCESEILVAVMFQNALILHINSDKTLQGWDLQCSEGEEIPLSAPGALKGARKCWRPAVPGIQQRWQ